MPSPEPLGYRLALVALAAVALVLIGARYQAAETREQLELERGRRDELEALLRRRSEQLDGALAKISELAPDRD